MSDYFFQNKGRTISTNVCVLYKNMEIRVMKVFILEKNEIEFGRTYFAFKKET